MINLKGKRVYLACGRTDMRMGLNGLTARIEMSFRLDPFDGGIFIFCNRNRNLIKAVEWDGNGFWLHSKRLERGQFPWPTEGTEATMSITGDELSLLLNGMKVEQKLKRNEIVERRIV